MDTSNWSGFWKRLPLLLAIGLVFARLVALLSAPIEALRGYWDFNHYYPIYSLPGWPFFNYWVEYPPIFPFLAAIINRVAGGQEHVFDYLMSFLLIVADAGCLYLFTRLVSRLFAPEDALTRAGVYLLVMVSLPYHWGYFEPIVVFFLLLGLTRILDKRIFGAGVALGIGVALKFFPVLAVLAALRRCSWKQMVGVVAISLAPMVVLYTALWLASPDFTAASLRSQANKGSWETVWALLDGNFRTGNFGPVQERLDPAMAEKSQGNPAVVPPLASLIVFGGVGLWGLLRFTAGNVTFNERQSLALAGFAWSLVMIWAPGWSPQWVLYLVPMALLILPGRQAYLFAVVLILVNLLEWPVMLSRGFFWALWITIPIRTLILAILASAFFEVMMGKHCTAKLAPDAAPLAMV